MRRRSILSRAGPTVLLVVLSGLLVASPLTSVVLDARGAGLATVDLQVTGQQPEPVLKLKPERKRRHSDQPSTARARNDRPLRRQSTEPKQPQETLTAAEGDDCAGLQPIELPGQDGCTHGPDPVPPDLGADGRAGAASAETVAAASPSIVCDGNGQTGLRVQLLYVHASDVSSRYGQLVPALRGWAGDADQIFEESAARTGGTRNLRFVHDASCQPDVLDVRVPPAGDDYFGATIREVIAQGHNRTDRIYVMFVETTSAGICGIATMSNDDRASDANGHNDGPAYARVDAQCWSGWVVAHELMHNLGGVQRSAPHASGAGHCIDEYDVMCYRDSTSAPPIQVRCPDSSWNSTRFDCGHDDYFNTNPAPGSYLATHWNPANNRFLIVGPEVPVPVDPPPAVSGADPATGEVTAKKEKKKHKHKKRGKGKHGKHHKKRRH
jgi:hypothetical protein